MTESREDRIAGIRARWQPLGREDLISVQDIAFLLDTLDAQVDQADEIIQLQNDLLQAHKRVVEAAVHVALREERAEKVFFHAGEHDAIVAAAVAAETERCAKVCSDYHRDMSHTGPGRKLAAAIRKPR